MSNKLKITGTIYRNEDPDYPVALTLDVSGRELFAALALAGIIAADPVAVIPERIDKAFQYADAFLAATTTTKEHEG